MSALRTNGWNNLRAHRCDHIQQIKRLLPDYALPNRLSITSADLLVLVLYDWGWSFVCHLLKMLSKKHEQMLESWLWNQTALKPVSPTMYAQGTIYNSFRAFMLGLDHFFLSDDDHSRCPAVCHLHHPLHPALYLCDDQEIFRLVEPKVGHE